MASTRTKLVIVILLNCVFKNFGDNVSTIDDFKTDILLRGSGERMDLEEMHIDKNINKNDSEELEETTTKEVKYVDNITENPTTTLMEDYFDNKDSGDETTTVVTDNAIPSDSNDRSQDVDLKMDSSEKVMNETTKSSTEITKSEDSAEAYSASMDDEMESQRNPKTDQSAPKEQDTRKYEKPIIQQAVSKKSTLRAWLEDSWLRSPAGILVPLRPLALHRALTIWNDLSSDGLNVSDIVIVGYDSNGVNWRSRHNLQPKGSKTAQRTITEALSKLLLKYQGVEPSSSDGTMKALVSAAKLVPYDSALFVITDNGPGDIQKLPLAIRALVEKRLKVYIIWTDPGHPSNESEQELEGLKNVSKHTEGGVLPYSLQDMEDDVTMKESEQQWGSMIIQPQARKARVKSDIDLKLDTLLVRRGGGEAISLGVPVESGVTALRIYIEGLVEHAVLYPPNDVPQIDLYNMTSVRAFSPKSRTDNMSPRDIFLVFPGDEESNSLSVLPMRQTTPEASAPTVGVWHLSVRCDTCDYRLCVTAQTTLHLHTVIDHDSLKLTVSGPVASVRESLLIDEYGDELAKLPFSYEPIAGAGSKPEVGPAELSATVALPLPQMRGRKLFAQIVGRNVRGEPFVRLSALPHREARVRRSATVTFPDDLETTELFNSRVYQQFRYNETSILPYNRAISQVVNQRGSLLTTVQIGLSTRLYGAPGDSLQLQFEVTNYREQSLRFTFEAVGELRFLRGISPNSQTIASGQTVAVTVYAGITATAQPGARDLITFTATSNLEQVSISAYIYVTNPGELQTDFWSPELRPNYQGTCLGRLGTDCAQHAWSATVIARDAIGGLLRLSSSPTGLVYDSNFIAGSREEVVATYRSTCCTPRVMVTAVDAYGNANSYVLDVSNYLNEASIAAIVLGVFLLIAIIALVVFLISWCVRRRRESRELPYTSTTSRNIS